jgi:carbamoylphosphate synthase small subunit
VKVVGVFVRFRAPLMVLQLTRKLENNSDMEITHVHLNDGTVAGMKMKHKNCFQFSTS